MRFDMLPVMHQLLTLAHVLPADDAAASTVMTWVDVMQKGGGWAMFILACGVITKLWMDIKAKEERIFTMMDKQNELLKAIQEISRPK